MNDINNVDIPMQDMNKEYNPKKKRIKKWCLILLSIFVILIILLSLGITPLGRYLSQIEWFRDLVNNFSL